MINMFEINWRYKIVISLFAVREIYILEYIYTCTL